MNKFFTLILLSSLTISAEAQKVPGIEPYGKVDQADLEMKDCDFEKGSNAEVLFDYAAMDGRAGAPMGHHTRIKIFNEFGKGFGNITLEYNGRVGSPGIEDIKGETINFENGKIEITPLDKKQIYRVEIDKWHSAVKFAMPNVKAGSIIEFTYRQFWPSFWYFQNFVPVRYSEVELNIPQIGSAWDGYKVVPAAINFRSIPHVRQPYVKSVGDAMNGSQIRAMSNIHSMPNEPYTGSRTGNLQNIEFIIMDTYISSWPKIGNMLMHSNIFGYDMERGVTGESDIVKAAKNLKTDDEKIAYIFSVVKTRMQWNGLSLFYVIDGTVKAWDKKLGNSAEINLIVYHLLKKTGIKAYPLVVCTKNNGKINPTDPTLYLFNNTVVYVPVDSTKNYVLDASVKENLYNTIPANILNTFGLSIDTRNIVSIDQDDKDKAYQMVFISNDEPAMQSVFLNAEIKPEGKIDGDAEITSYSYNKIKALRLYDTIGEVKYIDSLRKKDNNLKIASFKIENAVVDSLPLSQKFAFSLDLTGSDGNYIYLNTNLFNPLKKNPFFSDERYSDIDFGYRDNYSIYSIYKLPAGYKTDALPKSMTITMPDQSIVFKRSIAEDNGTLLVKFVLDHKKTLYFKEQYQDINGFYKKMYELLNEQIVLKKI